MSNVRNISVDAKLAEIKSQLAEIKKRFIAIDTRRGELKKMVDEVEGLMKNYEPCCTDPMKAIIREPVVLAVDGLTYDSKTIKTIVLQAEAKNQKPRSPHNNKEFDEKDVIDQKSGAGAVLVAYYLKKYEDAMNRRCLLMAEDDELSLESKNLAGEYADLKKQLTTITERRELLEKQMAEKIKKDLEDAKRASQPAMPVVHGSNSSHISGT